LRRYITSFPYHIGFEEGGGRMIGVLTLAFVAVNTAFYVAPDGRDEWSGTRPTPNRSRTDGPFATLGRAIDAIRQLKARGGGKLDRPVTVFIKGGNYFLDEPLTFTPDDSGTKECPITFKNYKGERVVISGGRAITGWKEVVVEGKRLWAAEIPEVKEGKWFFRELWIDGERRKRARNPNKGYLSVAEPLDVTPQSPWHEGQKRFAFHRGDMSSWPTASSGEVVVMNKWVESRLPIVGIDEGDCVASFSKRSVFKLDPGDLYYVEHVFELLDEPGEWYLDRKGGILYYMPMPGEDIGRIEAIAPRIPHLIRMIGDPGAGRYVENLIFQGLTFSHTEWYPEEGFRASWPGPDVGGFSQAAFGVPGAIFGEGVRDCAFEGCSFSHIGNYAIELSRGCRNNRISGCEIFDLGAGGIKIGETTIRDMEGEQSFGNLISDCHIHDGGLIFHSAVGIWIGQSYNNIISHNHIHDFYYTGISIGWTWGYGRSLAYGNVVEYNHVHHIGVRSDGDGPILSDMGGIYTLGIQPGTVIRFNIFHDIAGYRYGGWGIYFDEGSTNIVAEYNIVYRTTHGGFHQHYGKENIVRNNIFAYGRDQQIQRSRPEPHRSFVFEGNIIYWKEGNLFGGNLSDFNFSFDRNIYWREGGGEIRFAGLSLEQWRGKGMDVNSLIADPMFVDPERGDFRIRKGSPAIALGFKPIDTRGIGPRRRARR
jgi:hypothetical protein